MTVKLSIDADIALQGGGHMALAIEIPDLASIDTNDHALVDALLANVVTYERGRALQIAEPDVEPPAVLEPLGPEPEPSGGFVCPPPCGRTFDSEHGLKVHRARTHGEHPPRDDEQIACTVCSLLVRRSNMARHQTSASCKPAGTSVFRCDPCGLDFTSPQALGAHRRHNHPKRQVDGSDSSASSEVAKQEPDGPTVVDGPPIGHRDFDPDAARHAAVVGITESELSDDASLIPAHKPAAAKASPAPVSLLPGQTVCAEPGCDTILSRYNKSKKCAPHESKILRSPRFARGATG